MEETSISWLNEILFYCLNSQASLSMGMVFGFLTVPGCVAWHYSLSFIANYSCLIFKFTTKDDGRCAPIYWLLILENLLAAAPLAAWMCFMVSFVADLWVKWRVKTAKKDDFEKRDFSSSLGWLMSHERPRTPKTSQWLQALDSADSPLSDIVFADRLIDSQVHRLELQWLTITTEVYLRASFLVFRKSLGRSSS